jgi:hypothetical protein
MGSDEVIPHVDIRLPRGAVLRLGMSRAEVEALADRDIRIDYRDGVVAFMESPKHWGTFAGIELFEDAADAVVAEIARRHNLDPDVYCPGRHTYFFPNWNMILWRDTVSDEDGDQGYIFDTVSLHSPGYYDTKTLAFIREQAGLPPEPG